LSLLLLACTAHTATAQASDEQPDAPEKPKFNAKEHTEWGSYYDPQNVFCGQYDCYAILGFDYENFGQPPLKEITQRYRALSREWHPDKAKTNKKEAKDRFVKISRAYEVLTDAEQRDEYDFMRYNQEAYLQKHGSGVLWQYAPKSDTFGVIVVLLAVGSALSWFIQKSKWQQVADRLVQAAVEDWGPREGGTPESKELRDKAMEILAQQELDAEQNGTNGEETSKKSKKKQKLTTSEKRKQQQDALRPIVAQLVDDAHDDFGAGFHKPTWKDLLVVKIAKFPYVFATGLYWNLKYMMRRLMKQELSEEEREVLTARAVGDIAWHSASEEDRKDWMTRDLWVTANMADWEEEQEVKTLSPSDQKRYNRMKKKGKKIDWDKED